MVKQRLIVNVSDAKVSGHSEDLLLTYSLGSCIGVCLYDPAQHLGGMLHYQPPDSKLDLGKARDKPFMFADTGMKLLVEALMSMGVDRRRLHVKVAGGAVMNNGPNGFDIGKRNYLAIRSLTLPDPMSVNLPNDPYGLLGEYVESATSLLEELEDAALAYERGHSRIDQATAIRRVLHKIKGESGMVGFYPMEKTFHEAENAFEQIPETQRAEMLLRLKDWVYLVFQRLVGR